VQLLVLTCEMLMKEPLEPLVTILMMLLDQSRLFCAVLPAAANAEHTHTQQQQQRSHKFGQEPQQLQLHNTAHSHNPGTATA
jgi:hypothetical protein